MHGLAPGRNELRVRSKQLTTIMRVLVTLVVMLLAFGACGDDPPVNYPQTINLEESKLPLGPGDKIALTIYYGSKEIKATYTLDPTGTVEVQYIGSVAAGGKVVNEVKDEIRARLADGYLVDPKVDISVVEINSLKVAVFGHVAKSGSIRFTPGMTITEAIAQAGGFSPLARKNMVKVTRTFEGRKETYKLPVERIAEGSRPNFPMLPGDEVFVPERPW